MQCLSEANAGVQKENTRLWRNMLGLGFLLRNKVLQTSAYFVNPVSVWGEGYQLIEHATLGWENGSKHLRIPVWKVLNWPQSAWIEVFPSREAMLKKSIVTVLMGSIFLQKNTSHMTKSLQPWKVRDFHLFFRVKGEFPNPEAFYSFSMLTKKSPQSFQAQVLFLSSWSLGSGNWETAELELESSWAQFGETFFFVKA